ncbi:hypothetical protein H8S77_27470 [Parabacteroides sp. BX2]|jgi:hypothetical protein|uniref:DUF4252 domain-containing protein n=1 Tax=Parabacteroides segnis TaxID=2763058 RepID=A0ABR7E9Y7_9BACT|nr:MULTISPECIES: hypothetical protein [Parabacteroides]MBC5646601.1 hypothetical protein [Parabacteroides segnis]MCM0716526.1 hypothetical protein [Parabacteroides sp. TA-V-105]
MKKILTILLLAFIAAGSINAQLPYSKLLGLSEEGLKEGHFKYDKNKNQYILKKSNGLNNTMNVLSAIGGQSADIKPHPDDYIIVMQKGKNAVSSLTVIFYKNETFHEIQTWLADNNIDVLETNSGKLTMQKFNYEDYSIELDIEKIGVSTTTGNTAALAKSIDESYNIYTYTIYTGIPPYSKWHEKQANKKAKRDEKGKKKELDDLM